MPTIMSLYLKSDPNSSSLDDTELSSSSELDALRLRGVGLRFAAAGVATLVAAGDGFGETALGAA